MSAKKDMMDIINKKAQKYKALREKTSRNNSYKKIVLEFIKSMDHYYHRVDDPQVYAECYNMALNHLYANMRAFEPGVGIQMTWDDPEAEKPVLKGVIIRWPDNYIVSNPGVGKEELIDVADLLLELF